jgi:hypothetical protein
MANGDVEHGTNSIVHALELGIAIGATRGPVIDHRHLRPRESQISFFVGTNTRGSSV